MATYYVRTDGNDSNAGTGPATNQAWQTIGKALGASGIGSGDTLYIAPGDYRQTATITVGGTYSAPTYVMGDPTGSQFSGITPGRVLITNRLTNDVGNSAGTFNLFTLTSINYLKWYNLVLEQSANANINTMIDCTEMEWHKCLFLTSTSNASAYINSNQDTTTNGLTKNFLYRQCVFTGIGAPANIYSDTSIGKNSPATSNYVYGLTFDRCHCSGTATISLGKSGTYTGTGFYVYNCTDIIFTASGALDTVEIKNCTGKPGTAWSANATSTNAIVDSCAVYATSGFGGYTITNLRTAKYLPYNTGIERLWGLPQKDWFSADGLYSYATGTVSGAPAVDIYDVAWDGGAPNVGAYNNYTDTLAGQYNPTERNASTITIAPGSTSQSIELYLGATGLTASTAGLSARYNRTRTASVSIPLVARTIAQAWTSGGFAEVDATNMPGVYRLDIPDAALAAGADDVTIVVRGASGTNGAVMTVKLSSGGLTEVQTASAVWDAATASYTDNGSFGLNVLRADQQNKAGNVTLHSSGNVNRVDADVHAIANDADAATELKGALLHNGTDYISADLLTPVSAATSVHIGPYQLLADGLGADQPLDVNVGTATSIDVQVTDANGTGIDITGATVSAKVYNSGGTLVATYNGTATYADNGRLSFGLTTTVTNTSGTYTVTVTRTTGATDTQIFGPLRLYVRPV